MTRVLASILFLASCAHPATPPTPPTPPTPMTGKVVSMETGSGAGGDDLKVVVSFHNDGAGTCQVNYALAFGHSAKAVRHTCAPPVTVGPNATAEGTCIVPPTSPMRDAAGRTEADMEVVDVAATCQ